MTSANVSPAARVALLAALPAAMFSMFAAGFGARHVPRPSKAALAHRRLLANRNSAPCYPDVLADGRPAENCFEFNAYLGFARCYVTRPDGTVVMDKGSPRIWTRHGKITRGAAATA